MNALRYGACFVGIAIALITAVAVKADTPKPKPTHGIGTAVISINGKRYVIKKLAPPWVCTMANRMEIFVDEDRIMYACECEALSTGHTCRWQVIGGVESRAARSFQRRQHVRLIPVMHVTPAVTG